MPDEFWVYNHMTPLCSHSDNKCGACHFCRGQLWCVPPSHTHAKSTLDVMPDDNRGGCKIAGTLDNYDKVSEQVNKEIKYLPQKTEMLRSSKGKGYSSTAITMPLSEREAAPTVPATPSRIPFKPRRGFRHELLHRVNLEKATQGKIPFKPFRDATQDWKTCAYCFFTQPKMKRCAGCHWARYCDRKCQRADWRAHRQMCCPDHCLPVGQDFIAHPCSSAGENKPV